MIRSVYIAHKGTKTYDLTPDEMRAALEDKEGLLWVSLEHSDPKETVAVLQDLFHFHPLAIEDVLSEGYQTPKVDDFGSYIFIILHALRTVKNYTDIDTSEINLFLGENYLVSHFQEPDLTPFTRVWKRVNRDERLIQNGSDFLCHGICDALIDDYLPLLDNLDDELELLEDVAIAKPEVRQLERLLSIKHSLIFLRRVISPQREVMNRLSRDDFTMIDRQSKIYFRDVYDHLVRFQDLIESLRDIVSGALDIYLNSTSLRLNEVMKALTIVSTIFLPLSFFAGVYGMNFTTQYPDYTRPWGIYFFWFVCVAVAGGMLTYFKRKKWF